MRHQTPLLCIACVWLVLSAAATLVLWRRQPRADDDDVVSASPSLTPSATTPPSAAPSVARLAPSLAQARPHSCRRTHGASAHLTTDDRGYTCAPGAVDPATDCCSDWSPRYACTQCTVACCADYAQCVACCMGAAQPFARCATACRTSSHSLEHNAGYALPDTPHCWRQPPSPSPSTPGESKILVLHE